ncbi:MAG: hypothetical protein Q9188_005487 [Gyalolechia gomerana]
MLPDTPGVAGCPELTWYVMAGLTLLLEAVLYDARSRGFDEDEDGRKVESMGDARWITAEAVLAVADRNG